MDDAAIDAFAEGLRACLSDDSLDPAFKALVMGLPTESDLAQAMTSIDPAFIHRNRRAFKSALSVKLYDTLLPAYKAIEVAPDFSPDSASAGLRAYRNALLDLIVAGHYRGADNSVPVNLAFRHFETATNMTDMVGGLTALMHVQGNPYQDALDIFYDRFKNEPLVVDKWFAPPGRLPAPGHPRARAQAQPSRRFRRRKRPIAGAPWSRSSPITRAFSTPRAAPVMLFWSNRS